MGVPDRPSQGKHGSPGSAGGQGQPRDGVPPILRYIPAFWNSLAPASLPKQGRRRRRRRTQRSWDSLLPQRNISGPTLTPIPTPSPRLSICRRLSFDMNPSRKRKPSKKETKTGSLPSLSEERNLPAVSWFSSSV